MSHRTVLGSTTDITRLFAGKYASQLWCWGNNDSGQLGNGTFANANYAQLVKINATTVLANVTDVGLGLQSTCAVATGTRGLLGE